MSGGVDSSVAAALLVEAGHTVLGFTLRLGHEGDGHGRSCCGLADVHDARRVADSLGIDHYVLDLSEVFEREVIADFVAEYARGRTPNPCVRCNQHVKFARLLELARAFDCDQLATGHYARIEPHQSTGRWQLLRGRDTSKDQSYVLWPLTQAQFAATILPLGGLTKGEVRALAGRLGLSTADKPESQDLCFVAGTPAEYVAARRPEAALPGEVVDPTGRVIGRHRGLAHYTVGQRKGLGLAGPEPLFVRELDAAGNRLVVAPAAAAACRRFGLDALNWVSAAPTGEPLRATAQVRYRMAPVACALSPTGASAAVTLDEPLRGVAPGQSAVFYDEAGRVLAGGTIAAGRDEESGQR